ncbi:UbiA prenyltransferase family protein [Luedemannella flava]
MPLALLDPAALRAGPLFAVGWAVLGFILASSAVYIINDIADRHRDRVHPKKRLRPIASGRVPVPLAYAYGALVSAALVAVVLGGPAIAWWPLGVYLVLNVAYTRGLKHVPLVDVFVVALGFVLRVVQGYLAAEVPVQSWLLIAVFAVCLLMILGKRRHEVGAGGLAHRPSLRGYSSQYLEYLIVLCAVLAISAFLFHLNTAVPPPSRRSRCSAPCRSRSSGWPATCRSWSWRPAAASPSGSCSATAPC